MRGMDKKPGDTGGAQKMPYKPKSGDKNPLIAKKREELAKKKAQIIKGQNTQTAAGSGYKPFTGPIVI
jgi:hypothetical protein